MAELVLVTVFNTHVQKKVNTTPVISETKRFQANATLNFYFKFAQFLRVLLFYLSIHTFHVLLTPIR